MFPRLIFKRRHDNTRMNEEIEAKIRKENKMKKVAHTNNVRTTKFRHKRMTEKAIK